VVEVDVGAGDIGADNYFELLLDWLELATTHTAAYNVVPSRTQRILYEGSKE
jgi:hypothetical protein